MGAGARQRTGRLWAVMGANLGLVGVLAGVGIAAHSLGVFAEGADYLADAAGIGVSILALHLEARPRTPRRPNGYPMATRYAAAANSTWLLLVTLLVAAGAVDRLVTGPGHVHGLPVLVVSAVAALAMGAGALLLGGDFDNDEHAEGADLARRAVLLDTVADGAAAAGVAATGGVIYATGGNYWLDPVVAVVISGVVAYHALRLLGRTRRALGSSAGAPSAG